jgi:hypothetical protein
VAAIFIYTRYVVEAPVKIEYKTAAVERGARHRHGHRQRHALAAQDGPRSAARVSGRILELHADFKLAGQEGAT